jgi:hypothetical protein
MHQKSKGCKQKAMDKATPKLTAFFAPKAMTRVSATRPFAPVVKEPPRILPTSYHSALPPLEIETLAPVKTSDTTTLTNTNDSLTPSPQTAGLVLLSKLLETSKCLPPSVPLATAEDEIAYFGLDGASFALAKGCADDVSEDYELAINPGLHMFWMKSSDEVRNLVRRGAYGIEGFCNVLSYFIRERNLPLGEDPRLLKLLEAVESL